jgi:probable phosphoglycerate mutase
VHLVRHGETPWSRSRRHTGITDIDLTEEGRAQARALFPRLAGITPALVLTSPRSRAKETCRLAGFGDVATVDERLGEWDYGDAEGRTTAEIRSETPGWSVWTHEIQGGETLAEVAARVDLLIADIRQLDGEVLLFGHAHQLRILGARWCAMPAVAAQHLLLDPASVSTLGYERETPAITGWNRVAP